MATTSDVMTLGERVDKALWQPRWKPLDSYLRELFETRSERSDRLSVSRGISAAVACFIAFGVFDLWLFPDTGLQGFWTRVLMGLASLALVHVQLWRRVALGVINATCAFCLFSAAVTWIAAVDGTAEQRSFSYFLVFGTIFVVSSSLFFRFRFPVGGGCSTAITLVFCHAVATADVPSAVKLVLVAYFVSFLCISLYLSFELAHERYVAFLNAVRAELVEKAVRQKGRQLSKIAHTDPLTGLSNRRAMIQEYEAYQERWRAERRRIAVLLIDVDHFKLFNDRYGHQTGDRCLVEVGQALQNATAGTRSMLGRYGGEEFIAICHVEDAEQLRALAQGMCDAVQALGIAHSNRPDAHGAVTVSIGASLVREEEDPDLDQLSGEADKALYLAKANGRNRTHLFDPHAPEEETEEHRITDLLERALTDGLVSLAYQPIWDLETGRLAAVETLMRLCDDGGAPVSPEIFIPVAEKTGLIVELGRWSLRKACSDILRTGAAAQISINVSAIQLRSPDFSFFVAALLGELDLSPPSLALEVTEGIDISSDPAIRATIQSLQALGVRIWLDDFGTGYASLSWLQTFRFDVVKIDRQFLHQSETAEGRVFLTDILQLLNHRDVRIVVEGVETEEQLLFIQDEGVAMAQGFLLCRPQPARDVARKGLPAHPASTISPRPRKKPPCPAAAAARRR